MERKATCSCGSLFIRVIGEPALVAACSCLKCQRRTGSVFAVAAYFDNSQVLETGGDAIAYHDIADNGAKSKRSFCTTCGSSVYWENEAFENQTGIAVGAFADPDFPAPEFSAWGQSKHEWVTFPEHCASSETQEFPEE